MNKIVLLSICLLILNTSCISKKNILYFQGIENQNTFKADETFNHIIEPDDLISIRITAEVSEVAAPFNQTQATGGQNMQTMGYLVDYQGFVEMPILGKIKAAGLTKSELKELLHLKLTDFIKDPLIDIRILNFKVTFLGEVGSPGTISSATERMTLHEAIAKAGDFKVVANRKNVLVIRDEAGVKNHYRVDLTSVEAFQSPAFYLRQNDLIYVEPRFTRSDSTALGANLGLIASLTGFALSLFLLINR
ncbi:polysaccharide biosynthesis/export family protein [Flavobacterium sp. UBA6135]|uniref:polysaccharide biosynthesis/export family protein n=1 Tax=Flavobacterium sp. UBA6135 TaxID=1946553 RepID=UPI0025C2AB80|nr:polysaccharide biosynthesis/export family protein [Flavobacterium sp. UBA6135]